MTRHLDVLVAESHPGLAAADVAALEAAGHTVHRCYEPGQRGFPCVAVSGGTCPLDGPIDVAYLQRLPMSPRATPLEDGIRCAVRQGVPVVERSSSILDPFEAFVDRWVEDGDLEEALDAAAGERFDRLAADVVRRIGPLLAASGLTTDQVRCRAVARHLDLQIHIELDSPPDKSLDQSLAVRALDAVRADRRRFGHVGVQVHHIT